MCFSLCVQLQVNKAKVSISLLIEKVVTLKMTLHILSWWNPPNTIEKLDFSSFQKLMINQLICFLLNFVNVLN